MKHVKEWVQGPTKTAFSLSEYAPSGLSNYGQFELLCKVFVAEDETRQK